MQCPKCQTANNDTAKFCSECGQKLEVKCPQCGHSSPPAAKFCGDCGQQLTSSDTTPVKELSFDEKIAKIQKYLPGGLTEKILAQKGKIEGERKQITVLFADMESFTPLVEKLGPEEAYAIMDQVFEILIHKVHDFEGTVNKMTGDGVMALFGAPIALEDAPQRAIRTALAIHQEIARFSDRMKQEKSIPQIKMRIGIHTGPVVVGTLGNDLRVEFTAVGDTVNLASRIQNLAAAGTTYVSDDTFKLTEGLFRFENIGEKTIKGKEKPVRIYQVIAPSSSRTRFDVNAERGLTAFIGRVREMELLLDCFERTREGKGQAISIVAEAGIGKSRLLYEFRKAVANEDTTFLEGKCLSYSRNSAYHPIADILRANFEILETDTHEQIRNKVADGLKIMKIDEAPALPYILELLAVKDSGIDKIPMSPEARKAKTLDALKRITLKGSEVKPLIVAVEDIHWMDKSSEDALKELLESISGSRVFLIFTYRPEFVHTWGSRSYHSQITLNRLSNREALAMASHMLETPNIDRELGDLILQKTEGVPFFIEEFIKSLKDLRIIERQDGNYKLTKDLKTITIPSTIQDVIMARVDALPEGAKEIIRTGSVIEREFSHELLKKVTNLPEQELLSHLSTLKDSELLYERGIYPQSTYIFKHALTREVAYDSILTKKKKQIHEKIAATIEDIYKEDICYQYGVLARHCIAGENYEKGAEYAGLEAKKHQRAGLYKDAIEYAKKSINCLEKLPQTEVNQKKIIDARVTLANYYLNIAFHPQAREAVEPILDLALALNYRKRLPAIYTAIGLYYLWVKEDRQKGLDLINQATTIAEEVSDYLSWWLALLVSGSFLFLNLEFKEAHKHFKQCLDFSLLAKNLTGIAVSKGHIAMCYMIEGEINSAYEVARETLTLAQETDDAFTKGMAYSVYGVACYCKGLFNEAKIHLLEFTTSYEKSAGIAFIGWAYAFNGLLHLDLREYDDAVNCYNKIIQIMENVNFQPSSIKIQQSCLERAKVLRHDHDINLSGLFAIYQNIKLRYVKGWMARNIGDVLLNMDNDHLTDAGVWFQKAIKEDTKNGCRWSLAIDHACYADWFKKKGDTHGAHEQLTKAIDIFRECGADGWMEKYEKELALIS